jgi:hypothetical protein
VKLSECLILRAKGYCVEKYSSLMELSKYLSEYKELPISAMKQGVKLERFSVP